MLVSHELGPNFERIEKENVAMCEATESPSLLTTKNLEKKTQTHSVATHPTALVAQSQQTTNASGKKPQTLSTATRPNTPSKPPQTLMRIVTLLEQAIYRYNPSVQFKATLEDVVEEIKKAVTEEKGRAASAVSSLAKAITNT